MIMAQIKNEDGKSYICPEFTDGENRDYEIVPANSLYEMIHAGTPLNISGMCVHGFSITEYRKKYGLEEDEMVDIIIDSVTDCLFCMREGIAADFSHCNFIAVDEVAGIMLDDNIFYGETVNFSYTS